MSGTHWAVWVGVAALALYLVVVGFSARLVVRPGRIRHWSDPKAALGLDYEDIEFQAWDGVRLRGWFIPADADEPAPTIVSIHGWPWSRMGTRANNLLNDLPMSKSVNLLPFFGELRAAGYNVLAFDLRNFGESESRGVFTAGWHESRDLRGALRWLEGRDDVDRDRIGVIGFSNGGNTMIFSLPFGSIKAGIAVQPTTWPVFQAGYSRALFGPLAPIMNWGVGIVYRLAGGPALGYIDTADAAMGARDIPVLYVQGTGDRWSSVEDVSRVAAATPRGSTFFPETNHRFEGYRYMVNNPDVALSFFDEHVKSQIA